MWSSISSLALLFAILGVVTVISYQNTITPTGIVIHHSAVPFAINNAEDVQIISEIHKQRGYSIFYWGSFYNIGYHYIILPNGEIVKGRPEKCKGAHTKGYNSYLGICLIGDFSETDNPDSLKGPKEPTEAQLRSLVNLTNDLRQRYQINPDKIVTHKSLDSTTECPGEKFSSNDFMNSLAK